VFLGGVGGGRAGGPGARHVDPLTGKPESFAVRAISIQSGRHVVELARVDTQGWFAGYQEGPYGITDVRRAVAAFLRSRGVTGASEADIIVSSDHEHASPSIIGIWGPPEQNEFYLKQVARAAVSALEEAFLDEQPSHLYWGSLSAPWFRDITVGQANANEGWPPEGALLALWARSVRSGATVATYAIVPSYPNIVYGPADLICPRGTPDPAVLSTDFPTYVQHYLETRLGGTALVAVGSLGDGTSPMQGDTAPSRDLPPVDVAGRPCVQTRAFDDIVHMGRALGSLVVQALAEAHPVRSPVVEGSERYVLSPVSSPAGPALLALDDLAPLDGGALWAAVGGDAVSYPIDRSDVPPYQVGPALGTWVTGLRVGRLLLLSEPGEFFPSIRQAWRRGIQGADGVFAIGAAQDFLGYYYPAYAYPFTLYSADEQLYNVSLTLGDQVTAAGEEIARSLGFRSEITSSAELSALDNHYLRVLEPGVQLIAFPNTGDIDPATGAFSPVLEGFSAPPRFNPSTPCSPPLLPSPPSCPVAPVAMGPYHWSFGDGTSGVSGPGTPVGDAYFAHPYTRPGLYQVRVEATDSSGQQAGMTLPVVVYPELTVAVVSRARTEVAEIHGGDGRYVVVKWTLPGGRELYGERIPAPTGPGVVTVTVTDGTGTMASASLRLAS
jgi:hypothetical protein